MCLLSPAMVVEVMGLPRSQVRRNLMGRWEGGLHPLRKVTAEAVERESACGPRIQGLDHSGLQASRPPYNCLPCPKIRRIYP